MSSNSKSATLQATKAGYETLSRHFDDVVVASTSANNFALPFVLTTTVSPAAFKQTPQVLEYVSLTSAPMTGTKLSIQVGNQTLESSFSPTADDPAGYTRWVATQTVSSGADGRYAFKSCALDQSAGGNCDVPAGTLLSLVKTGSYVIDNVGPKLTSTYPQRFANLTGLSSVGMGWSDSLAGLDLSSMKMWIDGVTQTVSTNGVDWAFVYGASVEGLATGVHYVEVEAKDKLGNLTQDSFLFTKMALTATSQTAKLVGKTVPVNPDNSIPPPSTLRIAAPQVEMSAATLTLNASTRVGEEQLLRPFTLGSVDVVFTNAAGMTATVSPHIAAYNDVQSVGILSPSATPLRAEIPSHSMNISDIVVSVPTGFNTYGSTAELIAKTVVMGNHHLLPGNQYFSKYWPTYVPVYGSIAKCFSGSAATTGTQCQTGVQSGAAAYAVGKNVDMLFVPLDPPADEDTSGFAQAPKCFGCTSEPSDSYIGTELKTSMSYGCPTYTPTGKVFEFTGQINLCSGLPGSGQSSWKAFMNGWIYHDSSLGRFPVWQQNRSVGGTSACPNGKKNSGQDAVVTGRTYRLVTNLKANDGATSPIFSGTKYVPTNSNVKQYVYLGTKTGTKTGGLEELEDEEVGFQLSNSAPSDDSYAPAEIIPRQGYIQATGKTLDAKRQAVDSAATYNGWEASTTADAGSATAGTTDEIGIITGTEFAPLQGLQNTFDMIASLDYQMVLDFGACDL